MRHRWLGTVAVLVGLFPASTAAAATLLYDWGFALSNGTGTTRYWAEPGNAADPAGYGALPSGFDHSAFDWNTGLGSISLTFDPGPGTYSVLSFVDHEINEDVNTAYNEYGLVNGLPAAGQTYQMETPEDVVQWMLGNHYGNINEFDGTNPVGGYDPTYASLGLQDISMGIGWEGVTLSAGQYAMLRFTLGPTAPSGFFLAQWDDKDPGGEGRPEAVYFSSSLTVMDRSQPVPEPATILLLGLGVAGLAAVRRCRRGEG